MLQRINLNIKVPLESVNLFLHVVFSCLDMLTMEHYIKLLIIVIRRFAIFWSCDILFWSWQLSPYNWHDNMNPIIDLQSASWWSVNIHCTDYWPIIGAPIIVPPILARSSAVSFNSANPTWDERKCETRSLVKAADAIREHWTQKSWYSQTRLVYDRCCALVNSFLNRAIVPTYT